MSTHTTDHASAAAATISTAASEHTITRIRLYRTAIRQLDAQLSADIARARVSHATWERIGNALGMTKQAAQQRYGADPAPCQQTIADFETANPDIFSDR